MDINLFKNSKIHYAFLGFMILISYILVHPKYSFMNDSLIKLIQAESLKSNDFKSENYTYFFAEKDPNYNHFPIDYDLYKMNVNEKFIGPFPIAFSFITAIFLYFFSYGSLPYLSLIFLITASILSIRLWNIGSKGILFLFLCTSINISYLEYSENSLYIALVFIGSSVFLFGNTKYEAILSALLFGLSVFLRLETLLYLPILGFSYLIFRGVNEFKRSYNYYFIFSFVILLLFFFLLNYQLYNHILGPRFLVDAKGFFQNINEKLDIYIAILFGSKFHAFYKLGFLGLTPIFILTIIFGFNSLPRLSFRHKVLLLSSLLYLIISPLTAPHDGHWSWGARYLNPLIFPMVILTDKLIFEKKHILYLNKITKMIFLFLILYSFIQTQIGMGILHFTNSITKKIQKNIATLDTNSIILVNSGILALHFGTEFLGRNILNISSEEDIPSIINDVNNMYPDKSIYLIYSKALEENLMGVGLQLLDTKPIQDEILKYYKEKPLVNINPKLITIKEFK